MTSESCAMMNFAGKKLCQFVPTLVSMPMPLESCNTDFPGVSLSTWNCTAARIAVHSVWGNDYLQYSWIIFPHCSTVP